MIVLELIVSLLYWAGLIVQILFVWSPKKSNVRLDLLPIAWVAALVVGSLACFWHAPWYIAEGKSGWWVFVLFGPIYFWIARRQYLEWKNSDDDRWKKRRAKLKAKVKVLAGKLVVEPVSEPARVTA